MRTRPPRVCRKNAHERAQGCASKLPCALGLQLERVALSLDMRPEPTTMMPEARLWRYRTLLTLTLPLTLTLTAPPLCPCRRPSVATACVARKYGWRRLELCGGCSGCTCPRCHRMRLSDKCHLELRGYHQQHGPLLTAWEGSQLPWDLERSDPPLAQPLPPSTCLPVRSPTLTARSIVAAFATDGRGSAAQSCGHAATAAATSVTVHGG